MTENDDDVLDIGDGFGHFCRNFSKICHFRAMDYEKMVVLHVSPNVLIWTPSKWHTVIKLGTPPYGGSDGESWHTLLGPPEGTLFTV